MMVSGKPGFDWKKSKALREAVIIMAAAVALWILWIQLDFSRTLNGFRRSLGIEIFRTWLPLALLLALGAGIFFFRRWRILKKEFREYVKAKTALYRRDAILKSVSFAAEQFLEAGSWEEHINGVLKRLGQAADVSRVYIFRLHSEEDGPSLVSQLYEWAAPGVSAEIDNPEMQNMPLLEFGFESWQRILERGDVVCGHVRNFSEAIRALLTPQNILSILVVPIFAGKDLWGMIGFDECLAEREWTQAEIDALRAASGILGAAIHGERAEAALRESEKKNRAIIAAIPDLMFIQKRDGTFLDFSAPSEELLAVAPDRIKGRNIRDMDFDAAFVDRVLQKIEDALDTGQIQAFEYDMELATGLFHFEARLAPCGRDEVLCVVRDITARKRLEGQIRDHAENLENLVEDRTARIRELEKNRSEMEKLAATGRMAAGVAHEINNPLAGIKNSFLLLKDAIPRDYEYYEYVGLVELEIERISHIVRQMYQLYKPDVVQAASLNLRGVLHETCLIIHQKIKDQQVVLKMQVPHDLPEVRLPEGDLRQILYNLLLNAIQATPPGEEILLTARREGDEVRVEIKDAGEGIPSEIRPHIFEPFFTTKQDQKEGGMGLGLTVSHSLASAMGGRLFVGDNEGKGSTFVLALPCKEADQSLGRES